MANLVRYWLRRNTNAMWALENPIVPDGDIAYSTDEPRSFRVGDGMHQWSELPEVGGGIPGPPGADGGVITYIQDDEPPAEAPPGILWVDTDDDLVYGYVPLGGSAGQALLKSSITDLDYDWADLPDGLPTGGSTGEALRKLSGTDGDVDWEPVREPPIGGTTKQVLTKVSNTDHDYTWAAASKDPRWTPLTGQTSVDEFDDASLNGAWVRVDESGTTDRVIWTESADVLSMRHTATVDTANRLHGLVRPLSSIGGAMAAGDAFITAFSILGANDVNYQMAGLVLSDGVTYGAGSQIVTMHHNSAANSSNYIAPNTNWNTMGTAGTGISLQNGGALKYVRLAKLAGNLWRADFSPDCVSWITAGTITSTLVPTHVGFWASNWGGANQYVASYEFIRRVSGVS